MSTRTEYSIAIEPEGRPHLRCAKCRMAVIWPESLTADGKATFASLARRDPVGAMRKAEDNFGFDSREAKVLVLHITRHPGQCHKSGKPMQGGERICTCRSVNLDW
jgi:hypothetical protein